MSACKIVNRLGVVGLITFALLSGCDSKSYRVADATTVAEPTESAPAATYRVKLSGGTVDGTLDLQVRSLDQRLFVGVRFHNRSRKRLVTTSSDYRVSLGNGAPLTATALYDASANLNSYSAELPRLDRAPSIAVSGGETVEFVVHFEFADASLVAGEGKLIVALPGGDAALSLGLSPLR